MWVHLHPTCLERTGPWVSDRRGFLLEMGSGTQQQGMGGRLEGGDLWDPQQMGGGEAWKAATSVVLQSWG